MSSALPLRQQVLAVLQTEHMVKKMESVDLLAAGLALGLDPGNFSIRGVLQALSAAGFEHPRGPASLQGMLLTAPIFAEGTTLRLDERLAIRTEGWKQVFTHRLELLESIPPPPRRASRELGAELVARANQLERMMRAERVGTAPIKQANPQRTAPGGGVAPGKRPVAAKGRAASKVAPASARKAPQLPEPLAEPPLAPLPPAPPCTPPSVSLEGFGSLSWQRATAGQVMLTLMAHRLAIAQTFDELLAPAAVAFAPHRYQVETARKVLRVLRGRAMLSDEVGLGKTIEAMLVLREYQLRGLVRRALVLVPAPLVAQWVGELAGKTGIFAHTFDEALETPEDFWASEGVLVVSLALARGGRHAPLAQAQGWDIVIVDEAHHVKNRTTLGWKLINELKSRFLLLLTATPIEKSLDEIYNLVTLLRPGQFKTAQAFRQTYVDAKNPTSPKNREQLRGLLNEVMIRNTRAQSGLRLPPRYVSTVAIDTSPSEQSLYGSVVALLREHRDELSARLVTSTLLLEAGSSVAALRSTLEKMSASGKHKEAFRKGIRRLAEQAHAVQGSSKLRAMEAVLAENPGKVLIFSRFRETLLEVQDRLRQLGQSTVSFHGGLNAQQKEAALGAFRAETRILVASDVGGEGQNLQFCSTLINYDLPWNPMLLEQRIGRLHRMGQEREVRVYNLCARGTAEERVLDVLDRRVHLFELVVGEMDMVLGNLEDDRDLEERVIDLYARSQNDADLSSGFDALAAELLAARGRYERTRAFDEALFGKDYEA